MKAKTVLIADDDNAFTSALLLRCQQLGLEVRVAPDAMKALTAIHTDPPDLILLDVNMPAGNGLGVCEMLSTDKRLAPIPVIMLTGRSDPETIRRCETLGAHYVQKGTDVWDRLKPIVCALLHIAPDGGDIAESPAPRATLPFPAEQASLKVLVIDDDPGVSKALKVKLRQYDVDTLGAVNGMQGYWMALKERPAVIIADYSMPEADGAYLLGRLKDHPLTKNIPIIVLTGRPSGEKDFGLERLMYKLGAAKFLCKPLDFKALVGELRNHINLQAKPPARPVAPYEDYSYRGFLDQTWAAQSTVDRE